MLSDVLQLLLNRDGNSSEHYLVNECHWVYLCVMRTDGNATGSPCFLSGGFHNSHVHLYLILCTLLNLTSKTNALWQVTVLPCLASTSQKRRLLEGTGRAVASFLAVRWRLSRPCSKKHNIQLTFCLSINAKWATQTPKHWGAISQKFISFY